MKKILILFLLASCAKQNVKPTQVTQTQPPVVYKQFSVTGQYQYLEITRNGTKVVSPFDVKADDQVTVKANGHANLSDLTLTIMLDGGKLDYCYGLNTYNKTFTIK